jgi:putative FmdB family regulatory protein
MVIIASDLMTGERRKEMPTYEYECADCKKKFSLSLHVSEHGKTKVVCPKCKGNKIKQILSTFITKTSRKS